VGQRRWVGIEYCVSAGVGIEYGYVNIFEKQHQQSSKKQQQTTTHSTTTHIVPIRKVVLDFVHHSFCITAN